MLPNETFLLMHSAFFIMFLSTRFLAVNSLQNVLLPIYLERTVVYWIVYFLHFFKKHSLNLAWENSRMLKCLRFSRWNLRFYNISLFPLKSSKHQKFLHVQCLRDYKIAFFDFFENTLKWSKKLTGTSLVSCSIAVRKLKICDVF